MLTHGSEDHEKASVLGGSGWGPVQRAGQGPRGGVLVERAQRGVSQGFIGG
jgi:hypothetical protein